MSHAKNKPLKYCLEEQTLIMYNNETYSFLLRVPRNSSKSPGHWDRCQPEVDILGKLQYRN